MSIDVMELDQERVQAFQGLAVAEAAVAQSAACCYLGDVLGLYAAMSGAGPMTPAELAERTRTRERYVREWLANQAAGGYVVYHPETGTFELPDEHAAVLADPDSPAFVGGIYPVMSAVWASVDVVAEAFRSGDGVGWHEHDPRLFGGIERLFGPLYRHQLVQDWIPALDGVAERLTAGGRVADIGCGHGVSTIVLAQAYPASRFTGYDLHAASMEAARRAAAEAGVEDRVSFEVAAADDHDGRDHDLVCFFDCLHDMGDPVGAATHARASLAEDGALLVVEPAAGDDLADNLNPISRLFYSGSVFLCTPNSLAQSGGLGLGAQAGEARLRQVLTDAGFGRVRVAARTPFNLVIEARP
ncbi:MAG: methyltransferase domain-containing protein [Nitriliruptoraceae bacterium]|nr:methyltransferase domain-containing protein [Nitriliruptoraceae bacterium]